MKIPIDELMRRAPTEEYRLAPLSAEETERIREKTMKKITRQPVSRPRARPLRAALIAAAVAVLLCGSVFAAWAGGWFGFERLFGEDAALIEKSITGYASEDTSLTLPVYTDGEQAMIEDGTMQIPAQATLSGGAEAETEDFRFTLVSMLSSRSGLYAIVRAEARTDEAAQTLALLEDGASAETEALFFLTARNNSGEGHAREWKNGAMSWQLLSLEDGTAWFALSNNGGEFEQDDPILFQLFYRGQNFDLFETALPALLETQKTVALDSAAFASRDCVWQTLTLTPIELRLDGQRDAPSDETVPEVSVTLSDGTVFALAAPANGFAHSSYGSYGSASFAGSAADDGSVRFSWLFSRLLDPSQITCVTIDGTDYSIS